ncbi:MAG: DUF1080 domain-containing protein [Verrucomicrobia bacterium]|nr:DUF1080 domain-containing protein [Verrucomicrobiota bacterium]
MTKHSAVILAVTLCLASTLASAGEKGFVPIFNGKNLDGWQGIGGDTSSYYVENGELICKDTGKVHIFTTKEYANFILRLEIKLDPGGNNGVGIRTKVSKQPHIEGTEVQVLDDPYYVRGIPLQGKEPKDWPALKDYQHHGSLYGVVPAKPGHLKPAGQWNQEEIVCDGRRVKVTLNGVVIVDADFDKVKPIDGHEHPGLFYERGFIGLHAHGNYGAKIYFRNMRVKELK